MKEEYFINEYVEMWIENGIFYIIHAPQVIITLENAKMNVLNRLTIARGKTYPVFIDGRGVKTVEKEARVYLMQGDAIRGISAGAFLISNRVQEVIGNFIINFERQPVPSKLFRDKDKALEWLEMFKRIN